MWPSCRWQEYADVQRGASEESLEERPNFSPVLVNDAKADGLLLPAQLVAASCFFLAFRQLIYIYPIKEINMRMGFLAIKIISFEDAY